MMRRGDAETRLESADLRMSTIERAAFWLVLQTLHLVARLVVSVVVHVKILQSLISERLVARAAGRRAAVDESRAYFALNCERRLTKRPVHLAMAFLENKISLEDVARLVTWSIASSINCISLYDVCGYLKRNHVQLIELLSQMTPPGEHFNLRWRNGATNVQNNGKNGGSNANHVDICVLSHDDGLPDIVRAARVLAESVADGSLEPDNIDESVVENALEATRGLPDPDVLVRFGLARSNMGFPPWQIRLTEIHDVDAHAGVDKPTFFNVLLKYSKCEQRFGR